MNILEKARSVAEDIKKGKDPVKLMNDWELAGRILGRLTKDLGEVKRVCTERDIAGLEALLDKIEGKVTAAASVELPEYSHEELERALKAFKKRMQVNRLADESKLGGRYTSGGRKSSIDAIQPPDDFPREIWLVLVRDGKLKDMGGGFFGEA
jgi:hypothetical protein